MSYDPQPVKGGWLMPHLDTTTVYVIASLWMALALAASRISIRPGISVALADIAMGVIGGTFLGLPTTAWSDVLASFGSGLLTFLASATIDRGALWRHLRAALSIGAVSFEAHPTHQHPRHPA